MTYSTNYQNTLILPAADCPGQAETPAKEGSVAAMQFALLAGRDYLHDSDDVLSAVAAQRKGIPAESMAEFRAEYFSKGQACFRASPLTKTFGWAIHADARGRIALIDPDSDHFAELNRDPNTVKTRALRNKRA